MKIKLKAEWLGHGKGTTLDLTEQSALRLISIGTAEEVEVDKEKPEMKGEAKAISKPPVDKMVKRPVRKK